jgi:hypothetical protein
MPYRSPARRTEAMVGKVLFAVDGSVPSRDAAALAP